MSDIIVDGAFSATGFSPAFLIAQSYATFYKERNAGGTRAAPFLTPIGPLFPDEQYVIFRGRLGSGLATFERHAEYVPEDQATHKFILAENWLNTSANKPKFKVSGLR